MTIYIASDHLGIEVKKNIFKHLETNGLNVKELDIPNNDLDDYPDFAFNLCNLVRKDENALGILICGNGVGMSIAANKVNGIRCVRAVNTDDAFKGKHHNGANVLAIGSNLGLELTNEIVDTFITTKPASLDRYIRRIEKIIKYENGEYNEL